MTEFEKRASYIRYLMDKKFCLYDIQFHNIESKINPPNTIYRNHLTKEKGVKIFKTLGIITQPVETSYPIQSYEEFLQKTIK